ncbi:hypothetical protein TrRE_jg489, partial [Triparma retinervis]
MNGFFKAQTFTCLNYTAAALDTEVNAYLPCPVPIIPEAEGFEWDREGKMHLPENYTCGERTYADEEPMHLAGNIFYSLIFLAFTVIPARWITQGVATRKKKLSTFAVLNPQEKIYLAILVGSSANFLALSFMNWYKTAAGPPQITLILQCISAWCVDVALVLAITGWTGMNNIQGRKAVVPKHYVALKHVAIFVNLLIQLMAAGMEPYISTIGDERVTSDLNVNYSYYDGTLSVGRQLANFLTETGYCVILFIEGRKLSKTLSQGKEGENPAAKKILKYMKA